MKRFLSLAAVAALSMSAFANETDDMKAELNALKAQVAELKKAQDGANLSNIANELKELKVRTGGDNIKWDADYRASYDAIGAEMANGSKTQNGVINNRLWLGMKAAPRSDLSFIGQLAYNKNFGDSANHSQANVASGAGYSNFDWVKNENAGDNSINVKNLYVIYFGDMGDVPYTASVGRRSSTNGTLANLREDDKEASPNGHMINVEFDGASFNFLLDKVTGVPGMAFKLCMGRGLTNANPGLSQNMISGGTGSGAYDAYMNNKNQDPNIDMFGFIFTPYDNGQYRVTSQVFKAWNLIGFDGNAMGNTMYAYNDYMSGAFNAANRFSGTGLANLMNASNLMQFQNVGNMYGYTVSAIATGIGNGLGDFADNTTAFVSWAMSRTDPNNKNVRQAGLLPGSPAAGTPIGMLGSNKAETGQSWYLGVQMPAVITKDGRIGLEYNNGSKYWRSFTYGEDTMVASKLAARGNAKEIYYIQPILGKTLTAELRYTRIDYDYTGSQGFFGDDGTPMTMAQAVAAGQGAVKSATDMMGYLRYRY